MNPNLTELVFVIDKSGSMSGLVDDTFGGFNGLLQSQKENGEGSVKVTTVLFSSDHYTLHDGLDIKMVPNMTKAQYVPGGWTALLDALGGTIESVQNRIDDTAELERPAHVMFAIITDGLENSSTKFDKAQIRKMIDHQTKGHGWQFLFLGANMDAFSEGRSLGINHAYSYTATPDGVCSTYTAVDAALYSVQTRGVIDSSCADCLISNDDNITSVTSTILS